MGNGRNCPGLVQVVIEAPKMYECIWLSLSLQILYKALGPGIEVYKHVDKNDVVIVKGDSALSEVAQVVYDYHAERLGRKMALAYLDYIEENNWLADSTSKVICLKK